MPALIKVKETGKNNQHFYAEKIFLNGAISWEKAKCVCTVSHFQPKTHLSGSAIRGKKICKGYQLPRAF